MLDAYGHLPMSCEANKGQSDPQVNFLARGRGYTLFRTAHEAVLALVTAQEQAQGRAGGGGMDSAGRGLGRIVIPLVCAVWDL